MPLSLANLPLDMPASPIIARSESNAFDGDLCSALMSLPSKFYDDRGEWIKIAIALKQAGEENFDLFYKFSAQSTKCKGVDDCRLTWESLQPNGLQTIASIYFHARQLGWVGSSHTTPSLAAAMVRYPTSTMKELLSSDFTEEYIVEDVLIKGMPCIFGGAAKSVKTGQLMDLAYGLSTGRRFLGKFACTRSRVMVLTGESGGAALQRRVKTLADKAGGLNADDDYFFISESLPKFKSDDDLGLLDVLFRHHQIEVVIIDPLYMCMGGSEASNIQSQGELLWAISDLCRKAGVTLVVAHHVTKSAARKTNHVLTLEDLTQAGFDAWARQWWLVSRREPFELGSGIHKFLVAAGNCSSHSAEWSIDIDEGTKDAPNWTVSVSTAFESRSVDHLREAETVLASDILKVKAVLNERGKLSKSDLRNKAGISAARFKNTFPVLIERGVIAEVAGKKVNSPHYQLKELK
ncbi:AAA family ATPase [Lacipirellula sp.]|uniref:AAA family ATPase n=1 Tax=Lacipirellula sp. TaxID=2691419 RepID=UPI003D0B4188